MKVKMIKLRWSGAEQKIGIAWADINEIVRINFDAYRKFINATHFSN